MGGELGGGEALQRAVQAKPRKAGPMNTREIRLVLGDQLHAGHPWFAERTDDVLYLMMEVRSETDYVRHHVQKVAAFFLAMRAFAEELQATGHRVHYLRLDDPGNTQSFGGNLREVMAVTGAAAWAFQSPDEHRLHAAFQSLLQEIPGGREVDTHHFLTTRTELAELFAGKKTYLMERFYRTMRKKWDVLLDAAGEPEGGKWNYDAANRGKWPKGHVPPTPLEFDRDLSDIVAMLERCGVKTLGEARGFGWAVTRREAEAVLAHFVEELLPLFGTLQDAMTTQGWALYHSRLSFVLNAKILSPLEVIRAVERAWRADPDRIPLHAAEGFIRQILGWREYVRGIYWAHMPEYAERNYFGADRAMPGWFWTGETHMACLRHAIGQTLQHSYAHHIQRLMVTGNFALLAGIHPDEVDAWYLGVYIDALEWVEMPNTRGMSQFADGGIVGTKPYAASANYLQKQGDYCSGCRYAAKEKVGENACPLNSLYWDFHVRNRQLLEPNPRIGMVYRNWDRKSTADQQALLERAAQVLDQIESL